MIPIGVLALGEGGGRQSPLPPRPPKKFWATQIFWAARQIGAKPCFKEVSMFFLNFEETYFLIYFLIFTL